MFVNIADKCLFCAENELQIITTKMGRPFIGGCVTAQNILVFVFKNSKNEIQTKH